MQVKDKECEHLNEQLHGSTSVREIQIASHGCNIYIENWGPTNVD